MAGGTALALQAGHRRSVDLDFFTAQKTFDEKKIEESFSNRGEWVTTSLSEGTVYGEFFGGKISLISYPFFRPARPMPAFGTVAMLAPADIAVMKIVAISQRGKKRDFFDLYWLCRNVRPLGDIIASVNQQYIVRQNPAHILKSLVYFSDAEDDPDPVIFFDADWKRVKDFFRGEVAAVAKKLMKLEQ